jgi:hypothetical protein
VGLASGPRFGTNPPHPVSNEVMRTPTLLLLCAFGVFAQDAKDLINQGVAAFKSAR